MGRVFTEEIFKTVGKENRKIVEQFKAKMGEILLVDV